MEDAHIVQLYWERDEAAIPATAEKYGAYCTTIARNILRSHEDAEECVNDTWLGAWNAMPPHRPAVLATFLGKLTRNLSFNRYKRNRAEKRGGGETAAVLEELLEVVSGTDVEQEIDRRALVEDINGFLGTLPEEQRRLFLCRYWYFDSLSDLAARFHRTENSVSVTLHRIRRKLQRYLTERGYTL